MNEEIQIKTMKDCILETWKTKLSYPFNYKDLEELERIIDYYDGETQQLKEQLQQRDEVIEEAIKKCQVVKGSMDYDIWRTLRNQIYELEDFSKDIKYKSHPALTDAYINDVKNAIEDICGAVRYRVVYKDDIVDILNKYKNKDEV